MDRNKIIQTLNIIFSLASIFVIISLVLEYGFYLTPREIGTLHLIDTFILWYFGFQFLLKLFLVSEKNEFLKKHWFEAVITFLIFMQLFAFLSLNDFTTSLEGGYSTSILTITKFWIILAQILVILAIISESSTLNRWIAALNLHPAQILMLSFLSIILVGSMLLMLPKATNGMASMPFLDALFTATSATCVTGLIVVDTGTYFTTFGQLVILILIQIGGLGLMTFSSFFVLLFRRNISLKERSMVKEMLNYEVTGAVVQVLKYSVLLTVFFEIMGAVFLYFSWSPYFQSVSDCVYSSIFHSISAFCNAGFSLNSDSLVPFATNYGVILTISFLIIFGGLGFPVLINLFKLPLLHKVQFKVKVYRLHTRLTLTVTAILLITGFIFFLFTEWNHALADFTIPQKMLNAFFQSVTTRTAGFNTISMLSLLPAGFTLSIILMYMGASPGGTGGGIKTTTVGLLFASIISVLKGRPSIDLYKREIPTIVFHRAVVVIVVSSVFIMTAFLFLLISNPLPYKSLLFEIFSAFGTVGLSTGITPDLNSIGKLIIIVSMYFGRIGVLTLTLGIMRPREQRRFRYPSANVMVG